MDRSISHMLSLISGPEKSSEAMNALGFDSNSIHRYYQDAEQALSCSRNVNKRHVGEPEPFQLRGAYKTSARFSHEILLAHGSSI